MAFTPDGIAPPGIPLLVCSPLTTMRYRTVLGEVGTQAYCVTIVHNHKGLQMPQSVNLAYIPSDIQIPPPNTKMSNLCAHSLNLKTYRKDSSRVTLQHYLVGVTLRRIACMHAVVAYNRPRRIHTAQGSLFGLGGRISVTEKAPCL